MKNMDAINLRVKKAEKFERKLRKREIGKKDYTIRFMIDRSTEVRRTGQFTKTIEGLDPKKKEIKLYCTSKVAFSIAARMDSSERPEDFI